MVDHGPQPGSVVSLEEVLGRLACVGLPSTKSNGQPEFPEGFTHAQAINDLAIMSLFLYHLHGEIRGALITAWSIISILSLTLIVALYLGMS